MNRKSAVMLSVVGIVLFVLLVWGLKLVPTSRSVPPFATVEAIEQNYERQIHHLLELVRNRQLVLSHHFNDPTDVVLFNAPEILEATLNPVPHGYKPLGSKLYEFKSRHSVLPRQPCIGIAVVNRHWDTQPDGNKLTVLEYHRRTHDDEGSEVGVILLLDFSLLEQKAFNL
jgi:hypothetical protein